MNNWFPILAAVPAVSQLVLGLTPTRWANRNCLIVRQATVLGSVCGLIFSLVTAALLAIYGHVDVAFVKWSWPIPSSLGVYVDSVTAVMLVLVSFVGLIVVWYSFRYLDGDARQGRFMRWMSFTIGAALLLVVSRNLVMFTAAWMLTSFGLHRLLTHFPERSWAIWAARKKFLISRLGDLMLLAALGLTYKAFGSLEYGEIFSAANAIHAGTANGSFLLHLSGAFLVLGAMTKSAQFPFHSWLPDTMETPTPVSALMHAGIINAGGFLVIRLSPLVSLSHFALDFLAMIGACTALYGGVVMLTQTSVKRSLAYSTIAQMGFMMLQCGVGAFSAALLHIVAHSAYKAHAFLSCGSVLESAARFQGCAIPERTLSQRLATLPVALALATGINFGTFWGLGIDADSKPGAPVLGLVLTLAVCQLIWGGLSSGSLRLTIQSLFSGALVSGGYCLAYLVMDRLLAGSASNHVIAPSMLDTAVFAFVAVGFVGVFLLQSFASQLSHLPWVRSLYVHAMNGFYIDIPARRLTARFYRQSAPVP